MHQLSFSLPNRVNAILVDGMAVGNLLDRLSGGSRGYDQRDADDLYDLIVQVALRDRSWWLPTAPTPHSIELVRPWFRHGAARWLPRAKLGSPGRASSRGHQDHELRRTSQFIHTAMQNDLPCLVTAGQQASFKAIAPPEVENALCDLVGQYNSLEQHVRVEMLRRGVSRPHLVRLRIPPLPFEVLRRSQTIEDVISHTLEVRDECRKLRRDLAEVSAVLADTTISPATRMRRIAALEESWRAARKLADGAIDLDHGKSGGYVGHLLASGFQLGAGLALSEVGSILGGAAGIGHAGANLALPNIRFKRAIWRLQPLGSAIRRCWLTSDRDMLNHLERIFGRPRFA